MPTASHIKIIKNKKKKCLGRNRRALKPPITTVKPNALKRNGRKNRKRKSIFRKTSKGKKKLRRMRNKDGKKKHSKCVQDSQSQEKQYDNQKSNEIMTHPYQDRKNN